MSHARKVDRDGISAAMMKGLADTKVGDTNLNNMLDNAGQTATVPFLPFHPEIRDRMQEIAGLSGRKFSEKELDTAVERLYAKNSLYLIESPARRPHVPKSDFHQHYSLIYHLIPESRKADRGAIEQVFAALKLDPPSLSREEVSAHLPEILAPEKAAARNP